MNLFIYQLKQAFLSLKQKPGFVFSIVSTMSITLGALLCVLTLNYLLLVEPMPYPEQNRLFVAEHALLGANKETKDSAAYSYPGLVELYKSKAAFEQAAMMSYGQSVIISHKSQPLVNTAYVTPELHQILASPMAMGRMFENSEAMDTNNPVAILSYNTWQTEFSASVDILEQNINLSGVSYKIIGVLAEHFVEPEMSQIGRKTQVWIPWDYNQEGEWRRNNFGEVTDNLKFIGLLKKGVSPNQAQQILTPLVNARWQDGVASDDFFKGWSIDMRVRSVKEVMLGQSESIAVMLLAGVFGLVLIACANISNLLMARTAEKQRQLAIQAAIGATKKDLFIAMFAEASLLMFMSIILALVIAKTGFYIMQQYLAAVLPRVNELSLSLITFGSAILITAVFALFFAKLSTGMINYRALNSKLQSSGKGSGLQVSKKTRQVLIASQVALATVLVFANFSLLKGAVKTINAPIGFSTTNISTLILNFSSTDFPSRKEAVQMMAEVMEKLEALPQVESIAQGSSPLDGYYVSALNNLANNERYTPYFKRVGHRYFGMIEQEIVQGDNFTIADRRDGANVIIVNQAFAKQLKADGDVLGLQISTGAPDPLKIIGIVKDITIPGDSSTDADGYALGSGAPRVYGPNGLGGKSFLLKLKPDQSVSREQLGKLLAEVDSRYSVFSFSSAEDVLTQSLFTEITTAVTTTALALITFFLAGLGLYGILSYSTQMRRLELGTRMAVGAKRYDLILMVIKDNMKPIIFGVLFSLVILFCIYFSFSAELSSFISMQLAPMFVATTLLISTLSLFACYLPLRKFINFPAINSLRGND
jgi:predicted permease